MKWIAAPVTFRTWHLVLLITLLFMWAQADYRIRDKPVVKVKVVCFKQIGGVYHCSNDGTVKS